MYISKYEFNKLYNKGIKRWFKLFYKYKVLNENKRYISEMKDKYNSILSDVNGYELDMWQKQIVLSEEKNSLVVAGAGSGKSLTILGRILYLVSRGISSRDILVISFTNEACNNLKSSLLANGVDMDILTFHKLGRWILKNNGYSVDMVLNNVLNDIIDKFVNQCDVLSVLVPSVRFSGDKDNLLERELYKYTDAVFSLKKLLLTFVNLFKGNGYTVDNFDEFLFLNEKGNSYLKDRNKEFLLLAKKVYLEYEGYLIKNKCIDFHDMIGKSIEVVCKKGIYDYKYIIVDEYQDTSLVKCDLIRAIQEYTGASLLAVGDDWQSIYRFTGSNLKIFTEFDKYFEYTKMFKLYNTYRNSLELINVTSKFILRNPKQIYKKLYSFKRCEKPIYIYYYDYNYVDLVNELVCKIGGNILVLGRNNSDLKGIKAKAMTVHKSKGLEADNVIIVNLEDKVMGFPNKIINDEVLKYVIDTDEDYVYAEERRLFYVALTRTKNVNYLFVNRKNPSLFVTELMRMCKVYIMN